MKKAVLSIAIAIWSLLALLVLAILVFGLTGAGAPGWVQKLPGYGATWKGDNSMVVFGGNVTLIKEESYALAGIGSLSVTGTYQSVYVTLNDSGSLTVRHYDYDAADGFTSETAGGTLGIQAQKRTMINLFGINVNNWPRLEISVPRSYADKISFTSASGSVNIEENAAWGDTSLRSASGSVRVKGSLSCGGLRVSTTSGSVRLNGEITGAVVDVGSTSGSVHIDGTVRCERLSVQTASGSQKLSDCEVSGPVSLKSVSGGIRAGNISGSEITCKSTSGGQTLGALEAKGMISLNAVSGRIQADAVRSPEHTVKTASGGIKVGELTGAGEVKSTSGSVRTG